jgi:glycosyltransferase involved in cell wall biosynthesis
MPAAADARAQPAQSTVRPERFPDTHMHIVHTEASRGWGGQEIRILGEAAGMIKRGHRVSLLCPRDSCIYAEAAGRGVAATALPIGRKNLQGLLALREWLKSNPADVINTHSSTDAWLSALACASLPVPPPMVRTRHLSTAVSNNFATRWLYGTATSHIVTTGEKLREQLMRDNGIAGSALTSVPTGIDPGVFGPGDRVAARLALDLPLNAMIIGIVATLRDWKGHTYLIEAFARMRRRQAAPGLLLAIVGDGPERERLESSVAANGVQESVRMAGNQSQVAPWLHAMDVFCLPSYGHEGVPQALMQAMSCALPVVSTPVGSIAEIIEPEITGLMVAPKNIDALCSALERLTGDAGLRKRLGSAARGVAVMRFGENIMLDRMEEIFRSAVAGRKRV